MTCSSLTLNVEGKAGADRASQESEDQATQETTSRHCPHNQSQCGFLGRPPALLNHWRNHHAQSTPPAGFLSDLNAVLCPVCSQPYFYRVGLRRHRAVQGRCHDSAQPRRSSSRLNTVSMEVDFNNTVRARSRGEATEGRRNTRNETETLTRRPSGPCGRPAQVTRRGSNLHDQCRDESEIPQSDQGATALVTFEGCQRQFRNGVEAFSHYRSAHSNLVPTPQFVTEAGGVICACNQPFSAGRGLTGHRRHCTAYLRGEETARPNPRLADRIGTAYGPRDATTPDMAGATPTQGQTMHTGGNGPPRRRMGSHPSSTTLFDGKAAARRPADTNYPCPEGMPPVPSGKEAKV